MDSLTQIALGSAVAALIAPARHRRAALIAGGVLGTLPDLDVIPLSIFGADAVSFAHVASRPFPFPARAGDVRLAALAGAAPLVGAGQGSSRSMVMGDRNWPCSPIPCSMPSPFTERSCFGRCLVLR